MNVGERQRANWEAMDSNSGVPDTIEALRYEKTLMLAPIMNRGVFLVKTSGVSVMNTCTREVADVRKPLITAFPFLVNTYKLVLDQKPRVECSNADVTALEMRQARCGPAVKPRRNASRDMKGKLVRPQSNWTMRNAHAVWLVVDASGWSLGRADGCGGRLDGFEACLADTTVTDKS